jgi:hypothetical protein
MQTENIGAVLDRYRAIRERFYQPPPKAEEEPRQQKPPCIKHMRANLEELTAEAISIYRELSAKFPWINGAVRARMATARAFNISSSELVGTSRRNFLVLPRHIAITIAARVARRSLPEIGTHFGGRDHTTILHGCRKYSELVDRLAATKKRNGAIKARALIKVRNNN